LAIAAAACAEASGEVRGGEVTPEGERATTAPPEGEPLVIECVGQGTKWSDLYRDIFGRTGQPLSCAYKSTCHGTPTGDGAKVALQCFDQHGCWKSLTSTGEGGLKVLKPTDKDNPEDSTLLKGVLRRRVNGEVTGFMPKEPKKYLFSETSCIDRIKTWIANGMPDD
jgi:hypothetical protein